MLVPGTVVNRMNKAKRTGRDVSSEEIAVVAYRLWEADGRPDGRAVEHWLEAEAILRGDGAIGEAMGSLPETADARGPGQAWRIRYGLVLRE